MADHNPSPSAPLPISQLTDPLVVSGVLPPLGGGLPDDASFRLLADFLPTLCWIANGDGYITWYNHRWYEYCGASPESMEGWGWQQVHDPQVLPAVMERWTESIALGRPFEMTFPLRGADGVFRPFLTRVQPVRDESGAVTRWLGVNIEISAQQAVEQELTEQRQILEMLNQTGAAVSGELELERVVQLVTDTGVEITGAQFGAFFYNVLNDSGEALMLYTLSGADRSQFDKFGMPRATAVFQPTFKGEGVIRSDDITRDRRYGHNKPHKGMPKGHLPVRSYLAVPVASRSGEVIGGLFFGHPEPARFTAAHESLMTGIAGQAAAAIDNARLFGAAQREIARREQAERALTASEAHLRLIIDSAVVGVYAVDSEGVTTVVNRAFLKMLGFEREDQAVGHKLHDMIHHTRPDGAPYPKTDCPIYLAARGKGSFHVEDEQFFKLNGEPLPVEYWTHSLPDGAGAICIFADISGRKAAEDARREFHDRLTAEVEIRTAERDRMWRLSQDLLAVVDENAVFTAVNPAWETVLGYTASDLVGRSSFDLVHPDDLEGSHASLEQSRTAAFSNIEVRFRHADGGYRCIDWSGTPQGKLIYAAGRDVTVEREQAAALKTAEETLRQIQKMEAVGQLTGGIAHDFNNMLAVIIGSLDLANRRIERGSGDPQPYLENAREGAVRAAALTQRLLAFSRQQPLAPETADLNRVIAEMSELLRRTLGETIQLETVLAGGLWRTHVDRHQLESAIVNLAVNARDAMPEGGRLTIESANCHLDDDYAARNLGVPPGQYVMIAVSDTGCGMSTEVAGKVFDPFFTTKPVGKGTGLGLSMVYGFIKQSGGNVKVYSEIDRGTTVKLYLPRYFGAETAEPVASRGRGEAPAGDSQETVLVVEDDPDVRRMSVTALIELGYTVLEASGGDAALAIIDSGAVVDLLFTDVVMPGMTGRQLAEQVVLSRPSIKVLYTTGYTRNAVVHNGVLDPGVSLLAKPFTVADLALKVRGVLDG